MSDTARQRVLVTGGAGYIGSHVCKHLHAHGYLPVCYDNLSTGHRSAVRWGPLEEGDIRDRDRLDEVLAEYRPRSAIHLAASSLVGESVEKPLQYYRNNVVGSLTLIEALHRSGVAALVFSSTCAVYGTPDTELLRETHPCNPVNPYGASKLVIERMLEDASSAGLLRHACLRYFNAASADPEGEIGEDHEPETHLIPLVLQTALGRRERISVFGTDYPTPDGTCIRDYIDVNDLAEAHRLAMESLLEGEQSLVLNLGTGQGHSVLEVINSAERVVGHAIPREHCPRRVGDPPRLVASGDLAERALGWKPRVRSLDEMIRRAWQWARKNER